MHNDNNDQVLLPHLSQSTQSVSAESTNTLYASSQSFNADFAASIADSRATDLSGPQFSETTKKIEKTAKDGWGGKINNTFKSNKSTLLAFGIVLASIVGGVMLAGTLNSNTDTKSLQAGLTAVNDITATTELTSTSSANTLAITADGATGEIVESASFGEGATHLARKAVAGYLAVSGTELKPEQKIYAEDYLQKTTGSQLLNEGDALTFSASNIEEAVNKALSLEPWQIENLTQYTQNVQL